MKKKTKKSSESFGVSKKCRTFASQFGSETPSEALEKTNWALSSAGSEHLPYKQRVGGSNPSAPTQGKGMAP